LNEGPNEIDFVDEFDRWHRDHEQRRASPYGFLAITGLHWLSDEPERFDDVPGAWSSSGNGVNVQLDDGEELVIDESRVTGLNHFDDVDEQGAVASFGDAIVEVARREDRFMIRPRDPNYEVLARYAGTPTYPPSMEWVARGTFLPYEAPHSVIVGASVDGLTHAFQSSGEVEFELLGQTLRLIAFNEEESDELSFIFKDQTSGETTYPSCRFLTVDGPRVDGTIDVDFNRATNPACAYTHFATCPLPPSGNHLPVRVEAGEMMPRNSHAAST
jgi:uncharacterized protein (DUF1684 family)